MVGLGIWSAVQLSPSAFLSSVAGSSALVHEIMPQQVSSLPYTEVDVALSEWSTGHNEPPPPALLSSPQRAWDTPGMKAMMESLLVKASNDRYKACLLANTSLETGTWLNALPIASSDHHIDDETISVAVGLHLDAPLFLPHQCQHYGGEVDSLGTHSLSCQWSEG